ncbi:MAG: aminomethyl transferase family protein [Armatimonadetes bacterium]|nr:aminomethyl transferase family protein [Armatimonadota bacterium]
MNRSPLLEIQKAIGAAVTVAHGWQVAAGYGAPEAEYAAARQSCALFDLTFHCRLRVTGPDREGFLHGRLTNDIKGLAVGRGIYAAALDRHGRMLADMVVWSLDDYHLLELPPDTGRKILESFEESIIGEDVVIEDMSATWGLLSLQGPEGPGILGRLGIGAPDANEIVSASLAGHPVLVAGRRRADLPGFDLHVANAAMVDCWNSLLERGARPAGLDTLDVLRIEAGIPWYGRDLDESVIPLEAGLHDAISYTKGCYVGQEIISRIHHLGQPARLLRGVVFEDDRLPPPGSDVRTDGRRVGKITSIVRSPAIGRPIALAYLRRGHTEPGTAVRVDTEGGPARGKTALLPFTAAATP